MQKQFLGTKKPRLLRIIDGLLKGPLTREQVDRIGGASNGPSLVSELRALGLEVCCKRRSVRDRDGKTVNPGVYNFTSLDVAMIQAWRSRGGA